VLNCQSSEVTMTAAWDTIAMGKQNVKMRRICLNFIGFFSFYLTLASAVNLFKQVFHAYRV